MTDEVRQEDREAAAMLYEWFPALSSCPEGAAKTAQFIRDGGADGWNTVHAFARHASPLRTRIAVLEGALVNARGNLVRALASSLEISDEFAAMIPSVTMIDATLNGEKK